MTNPRATRKAAGTAKRKGGDVYAHGGRGTAPAVALVAYDQHSRTGRDAIDKALAGVLERHRDSGMDGNGLRVEYILAYLPGMTSAQAAPALRTRGVRDGWAVPYGERGQRTYTAGVAK